MNYNFKKQLMNEVDALLFGEGVTAANRFSTYLRHRRRIPSLVGFYALGQAYRHSEPYWSSKKLKECFREANRVKGFNPEAVSPLMNEEEKAYLATLPNTLTLCQWAKKGSQKPDLLGASWWLETDADASTQSKSVSPFKSKVLRRETVKKQQVLALFLREGWVEVIYLMPKRRLRRKPPKELQAEMRLELDSHGRFRLWDSAEYRSVYL